MVHTATGSSFKQVTTDLKDSLIKQGEEWTIKQNKTPLDQGFDFNW